MGLNKTHQIIFESLGRCVVLRNAFLLSPGLLELDVSWTLYRPQFGTTSPGIDPVLAFTVLEVLPPGVLMVTGTEELPEFVGARVDVGVEIVWVVPPVEPVDW